MMQSVKKDKLVHCSECNGVLLKNVEKKDMKGEVSFLTRCPHCNSNLDIKLSLDGNTMQMNSEGE